MLFSAQAQDDKKLEVPLMIEQVAGKAVIFKVNWNDKNQFSWTSDIEALKFDQQEKEFYWEHTQEAIGLHQVRFQVKDTFLNQVNEATTLIKIVKPVYKPQVNFKPDSLKKNAFIELRQGQNYQLEFEATSSNQFSQDVLISYLINNNPAIKEFDQSEFSIVGNRLLVQWQPTQVQADHKYQDLQLIAIDQQNQVSRQVYHFMIIDEDLPPVFKYSINQQYTISPNRLLTIDFSVNDPDGDEYFYEADLSTNVGLINVNQNGQFSWQLSKREMALLSDKFPISLSLKVIDKITGQEMLSKIVNIIETRDNSAPEITRLSNLSVKEGYAIKRRIFYRDNNHTVDQLDFKLENAPSWLVLEQHGEALYLVSDTIGFDVVKADGISVQYDVLLTVTDPQKASDNQFFTITVNEGINTNDIFDKLKVYNNATDAILEGLREKIRELDHKLESNAKLKRSFLLTSIFLGGYSGIASFFDEHTIANQAVPYTGAILAISSSVNALAFNQDGDITTVKVKLEQVEKELIRNRSYLKLYDINSEQDEQLRNPEVADRIKSFRQQLIEQRIELEKLEEEYRQLNYVKRKIKKATRRGNSDPVEWTFL